MELEPNRAVYDWPVVEGPANEVWFIVLTAPDGSFSFWYHVELVATTHSTRGRAWVAIDDRQREESSFYWTPVDVAAVDIEFRPFALTAGDHGLTSRSSTGRIDGDESVDWSLEWIPDTYTFTPSQSPLLTDILRKFVGTGAYWSRNNSISIDGSVTVEGRSVELSDARGMQGHILYPTSPVDTTWVYANQFDTAAVAADEVVLEALQFGRFLSCVLRVDDDVYEFNRVVNLLPVGPLSNTVIRNEVGDWHFRARGRQATLRATVSVESDCWHRVVQQLADGRSQYVAHCPAADLSLSYAVDSTWQTVRSNTARAEWYTDSPPVEGTFNQLNGDGN